MSTGVSLTFKISRDFSGMFCDLHNLGLSCKNAKETTVVNVCCQYFRDEVETALNERFGSVFVKEHIRFSLPQSDIPLII